MCKCIGYFQFALVGLVASAVAAPSGILAGDILAGGCISCGGYAAAAPIAAAPIIKAAAPVVVKSYPLADSVPAGLNGLQVKILLALVTSTFCIKLGWIFMS